ncbi:hypothetical protein ACHHYP_01511 [Achlya hypogyna]|uniref:Uncharacterized protein n=1 Tax=Achlya hypogyna TaxID=1202772 RepID=A0A1V9ZTB8_ACHHY|nr:hypothetical protein ACHHYP_01511 [Achlya hypogyna]
MPATDDSQRWHAQRHVHGHTATLKELRLNEPRVATRNVHVRAVFSATKTGGRCHDVVHHNESCCTTIIHGLPTTLSTARQVLETPLTITRAIEFGDLTTVQAHLAAGADPNTRNGAGETLLHIAILHERPAIVQLLLERGADPNARSHWEPQAPFVNQVAYLNPSTTAAQGATPLHYACAVASVKLVKTLLAAGASASIDVGNHELCQPPVVWALSAPEHQVELVKLLHAAGAAIAATRDVGDNTVITTAVVHHASPASAELLRALLAVFVEAGVDIAHKNSCGWTAWDEAPSPALRELLRTQFGAASGRISNAEGALGIADVERQRDECQPWLRRPTNRSSVLSNVCDGHA